jgi:hypothetical protein
MKSLDFISFLQSKLETSRQEFLEAKRQLEDFEQECGSMVYSGKAALEDEILAEKAHLSYVNYRKAWVEWYAAVNGISLESGRQQKDTPAFAAHLPIRFVVDRIKKSAAIR